MKNSGDSVKRILVAEDEPAIGEVCQRVLNSEGFEVDIAANGDIAQDMLGKKDYNLCLIDIRTPVMDGKQLYQVIIAKHPELTNGVIFTTGDVADVYTQRFLELAHRPYLLKPFTPDQLKNIVTEALRQMKNG